MQNESIKVLLRLRPLIKNEHDSLEISATYNTKKITIFDPQKHDSKTLHQYKFTRIYNQSDTTKDLYDDYCYSLVQDTLKGYNTTVLCYGASGSGKTFTLYGDANGGLIHFAAKDLFNLTMKNQNVLITLSYLQVYMDHVIDLLGLDVRKYLLLKDTKKEKPDGLQEHKCTNYDEFLSLFEQGNHNLEKAPTRLNENSSKSHTILTLTIKWFYNENSYREGTLGFVNLAGLDTKMNNTEGTLEEEAPTIDLSHLDLENVICSLETERPHVPYSDSKITLLLRQSLGGNAKTVFITNMCMRRDCFNETYHSLKYAFKVKKIKNQPQINEKFKDAQIMEINLEISKLKTEVEELEKLAISSEISFTSVDNQSFDKSEEEEEDDENFNLKRKLRFKYGQIEALNKMIEFLNEVSEKFKPHDMQSSRINWSLNDGFLETTSRNDYQKIINYQEKEIKLLTDENNRLKNYHLEQETLLDEIKKENESLKKLNKDQELQVKLLKDENYEVNYKLNEFHKINIEKESHIKVLSKKLVKQEESLIQYKNKVDDLTRRNDELASLCRRVDDQEKMIVELSRKTSMESTRKRHTFMSSTCILV